MPSKKSDALLHDDSMSKNIFDILGIADLPDNQKATMLQKLIRIIYQRVIARIIDALSDDSMRTLKTAIQTEDEHATTVLLAQSGLPSFEMMMAEEALFIKHEMNLLSRGDAALH